MTKLRFGDRIWSALMGVVCLVAAAVLVLYTIGYLPVQQIKELLALLKAEGWHRWAVLAAATLVLVLLALRGFGMLFRRRKEKGFVVQKTEFGDMSISMKAMENMVRKCVDIHSELTVNHTSIYLVRNGVSIDLKVTLASGINIPLTVNALQKQIKQYITSCSGVEVYEVRVKVETDAVKLLPPPQAEVIAPAPVEEVKCVEPPVEKTAVIEEEPTPCEAESVKQEEETVCAAEEVSQDEAAPQTVEAEVAEMIAETEEKAAEETEVSTEETAAAEEANA